jgi:hypothetical protein
MHSLVNYRRRDSLRGVLTYVPTCYEARPCLGCKLRVASLHEDDSPQISPQTLKPTGIRLADYLKGRMKTAYRLIAVLPGRINHFDTIEYILRRHQNEPVE